MSSDSDGVNAADSGQRSELDSLEGASAQRRDRFGRLHASSIFFDVLSHIRTMIVPAVVAVVGAAQGSGWWLAFAVIFVVTGVMV